MVVSDVMPLLLEACPQLRPAWEEHLKWWQGEEERGNYNDISVLARYLVENAAADRTECFAKVFHVVERMIDEGDDAVRELATVGLIEDIQNIALNTGVDHDLFLPWLGPHGRRGWYDIIRLWHGTAAKGWPGKLDSSSSD